MTPASANKIITDRETIRRRIARSGRFMDCGILASGANVVPAIEQLVRASIP
jgi:hypothetical protein